MRHSDFQVLCSDDYPEKPFVSVIMLAYNHENFISQSIDSIVSQKTDFSYEIIIGEDCSTDGTRSICLEYQKKYPQKIKLILHKKNQGLIGNFKSLLAEVRGCYVSECACDDYWCDSYKLQKHIDFMEVHQDVVVTYHDVWSINETGNIDKFIPDSCKRNYAASDLLKGLGIMPQSICMRNSVISDLIENLSPNVYNEDLFTISVLGTKGSGVFISNINPTMYRIHSNGIYSMKSETTKSLMLISTYSELIKFHEKRNNEEISLYFTEKVNKLFSCLLSMKKNQKEKKFYLILLFRNLSLIGIRNFCYYLKNFVMK